MSLPTRPPPRVVHHLASRMCELVVPLRVPAVRVLWFAQVVSDLGDWAARLALSVLVYQRTGSAAAAGLATAISLVPWLGPGQLVTLLSERWPRRRTLIVSDVLRAAAYTVAALPVPVPMVLLVVFVAGLATPPFDAARSALRPEVTPPSLLGPTLALGSLTEDVAMLSGYLLGGLLITFAGADGALLVNAATFAVSAVVLTRLPAGKAARGHGQGGLRSAARALRGDPLIVRGVLLVTAAVLAGASVVAMSAPLVVGQMGRAPGTVSLLVAVSAGVTILTTAALRANAAPQRLLRVAAWLTLAGGAGVVVGFLGLGLTDARNLWVALIAFACTGLLFVVLTPANIVVSPRLPGDNRASALGLLMGLLVATEALGAALAGVVSSWIGVPITCAALGMGALAVGAYGVMRPVRAPTSPAGSSRTSAVNREHVA